MSDGGSGDGGSGDAGSGSGSQWRADLLMALRFFSRLPTGRSPHEAPDLSRMAPALPVAGLVIGLGPAVLLLVFAALDLSPLVVAGLALAASALVTGAMSEDALADAADGLGGGTTPERRLEIMKDSRHGTYGVLAIVLVSLIRAAALSVLIAVSPFAAAGIWLAAGIVSRSTGLYLPLALDPARATGAASAAGRPSRQAFGLGAGFAILLAVILAGPFTSFVAVVVALIVAGLVARGWQEICRRLVGGQTGDLTGALIGLIEVATLLVFLAFF